MINPLGKFCDWLVISFSPFCWLDACCIGQACVIVVVFFVAAGKSHWLFAYAHLMLMSPCLHAKSSSDCRAPLQLNGGGGGCSGCSGCSDWPMTSRRDKAGPTTTGRRPVHKEEENMKKKNNKTSEQPSEPVTRFRVCHNLTRLNTRFVSNYNNFTFISNEWRKNSNF